MMMNAESAMTLPLTPTNPSAYGRSQRGARENTSRISAASRPQRSASPTASMIVTTVRSGGNPMKFSASPVKKNSSPAPLRAPRTGVGSASPGIVTPTPNAAITEESTATTSVSSTNSMKGSGRRLPTRSIPSRKRSRRPGGADGLVLTRPPSRRSVEVRRNVQRAARGGELGVDRLAQGGIGEVVHGGEGEPDGAVADGEVARGPTGGPGEGRGGQGEGRLEHRDRRVVGGRRVAGVAQVGGAGEELGRDPGRGRFAPARLLVDPPRGGERVVETDG